MVQIQVAYGAIHYATVSMGAKPGSFHISGLTCMHTAKQLW